MIRHAAQQALPDQRPHGRPEELGDLRFRSLLTEQQWRSLPEAVCRRFSKRVRDGATLVFIGRLSAQRHNRWGKLLAGLLRLVGAPLPVSFDIDVPSVVTVTEDVAGGGQIWTRLYANRSGFPQIIHSAKRFRGPTGLEEYIGCGISIALRVTVESGTLVFRDQAYHIDAGPLRLTLPRWLSPGRLVVRHAETQHGWFRFSLQIVHPWFGELLYQEGVYREERP